MNSFLLLLKKDLLLEWRRKELIAGLLLVTLILAFLFVFSLNTLILETNIKRSLALIAVWISGLLSGLVAIEKSLQADFVGRVLDRLITMQIPMLIYYLSKLVQNFFALLSAFILAYFFIHAGLNLGFQNWASFVQLAVPVALAIASLLSLLIGITYNSRLAGLLLIILALPLLIPLFAFVTDLSIDLAITDQLNLSSISYNFILLLVVIYLLLGINLADYVYRS